MSIERKLKNIVVNLDEWIIHFEIFAGDRKIAIATDEDEMKKFYIYDTATQRCETEWTYQNRKSSSKKKNKISLTNSK